MVTKDLKKSGLGENEAKDGVGWIIPEYPDPTPDCRKRARK